MLLNQNDVAVDEEKVIIIATDSSTETDFGEYESSYDSSLTLPAKLQKPPVKQRRVFSLTEYILFRMLKCR